MVTPAEFLQATASGTRVVVRHVIDDRRATDSLGYFHLADDTHCVVATKRGLETIELSKVIAAKEVPPPPAPRPRTGSPE